jgi:hypothetical protein
MKSYIIFILSIRTFSYLIDQHRILTIIKNKRSFIKCIFNGFAEIIFVCLYTILIFVS